MSRGETARERELLRLIRQQQDTINDFANRLMYVTGNAWTLPPRPAPEPLEREERTWTATPEQEPVY